MNIKVVQYSTTLAISVEEESLNLFLQPDIFTGIVTDIHRLTVIKRHFLNTIILP